MHRSQRQAAATAYRAIWNISTTGLDSDGNVSSNDDYDDDENDAVLSDIDSNSDHHENGPIQSIFTSHDTSTMPSTSSVPPTEYVSRNGERWNAVPDIRFRNAQTRQWNILRESQGPTRQAIQSGCGESPADAFKIFLSTSVIDEIVLHTNSEARRRLSGADWNETNRGEMYCFIGLLLLSGVYQAKNEPIAELWSKDDGRAFFAQSMSRDRFKSILRFIRFDDRNTRTERSTNDKLAPLRSVLNSFIIKCRSSYKAGIDVTIDEQLMTFRGRCPFKMYLPDKPGRYGVKIWILADSKTNYCCNLEVYTGKRGSSREVGQSSRVVLELTDYISNSGRNVTGDNFFTSLPLVRTLLGRNLTCNGTIRKNKADIPPELVPNPQRQVESSIFAFQRNCTMVSYVPKRNKAVILLSSGHDDSSCDSSSPFKPNMILDYNSTKGGVDTLDQMVRQYSCKRKTRRWPLALFMNILDIASYNAYVLFLSIHPSYKNNAPNRRRQFIIEMGKQLIAEYTCRLRPTNEPMMHESTQQLLSPRRRCRYCPYARHRKSTMSCSVCRNPICKEHGNLICLQCIDGRNN